MIVEVAGEALRSCGSRTRDAGISRATGIGIVLDANLELEPPSQRLASPTPTGGCPYRRATLLDLNGWAVGRVAFVARGGRPGCRASSCVRGRSDGCASLGTTVAARAGEPTRITCPPKITAQIATQVQPRSNPPSTSDSRARRGRPSNKRRQRRVPQRDRRGSLRLRGVQSRPSTRAMATNVAAAAVVCPLANEGPVKPAYGWTSGRVRWTASLIRLASQNCPPMTKRGRVGSSGSATARPRTRQRSLRAPPQPGVEPSHVSAPSTSIESTVIFGSVHAATVRSTSTRPVCFRTM